MCLSGTIADEDASLGGGVAVASDVAVGIASAVELAACAHEDDVAAWVVGLSRSSSLDSTCSATAHSGGIRALEELSLRISSELVSV